MPVKKIHAHGKTFKFGRQKSPPRRKLHLSDYATAALPTPPASFDDSGKSPLAVMTAVFENDTLGCCVIADNARFLGIITGNASGTPFVYTDNQTIADYSAIGGYVPGDEATDNGCDPEAALQYYQTHGYADGSKLACWYAIDGTNQLLVKQAIWLGGPIALALDLPDAWISPFPSANGFVWDVAGAPDPSNGHEVNGYGYTAQGILIDTWGLKGVMTWAAVAAYCTVKAGGNLYGRMDPEMVDKASQLAPSGFDWAQLLMDATTMGGSPVIPPTPTPPVPPTPPTPPVVPPASNGFVLADLAGTVWIAGSLNNAAPTLHLTTIQGSPPFTVTTGTAPPPAGTPSSLAAINWGHFFANAIAAITAVLPLIISGGTVQPTNDEPSAPRKD